MKTRRPGSVRAHRRAVIPLLLSLVLMSSAAAQSKPGRGGRPTPTPIPTPPPSADDPVTLPYGFTWGDSEDMVLQSLPRVKAKIKEKKPLGANGEIWVLTGIEVPGLRESRAIFQEKQLVGLDLEYGAADWPVEKFRGAMSNLRRKLETMFAGAGAMLKRGPVEGNEDASVDQILTGYEWRRGDTIVLLVYFSAEKKGSTSPKDAFRSMTIRYRFQQPPPEALPTPVPKTKSKSGKDPLPEAESSPTPAVTPTPTPASSPSPGSEPMPSPTPGESTEPTPTPTPEPLQNVLPEILPTPTADNPAASTPAPSPESSPATTTPTN